MPTVITRGAMSAQGYGFNYKAAGGGAAVYVEDVFSTYLYKGTGAAQTITNNIDLSTNGGLVWIKDRTNAYPNNLFDTTRGATYTLHSNYNDASSQDSVSLTAFNSNGFSLGTGNTSFDQVNTNTDNFVSWTFRKQAKFFDIVTYTGTGSARTISHNLGSTPGMIIVKCTTNSYGWLVYHSGLTSASYYLFLQTAGAEVLGTTGWNGTAPTSTEFSVGTALSTNAVGETYVAYLFASDAGGFGLSGTDSIIKCGSFDPASNATVNLGWEPQFVIYKPYTAAGDGFNWCMADNMRGFNVSYAREFFPNKNYAEANDATNSIKITSTGFTAIGNRTSYGAIIYLAIRRGPMKTPTSGTSVFSPITSSAAAGTAQTTNFVIDSQWNAWRDRIDYSRASVNDRLIATSSTTTGVSYYLVTSGTYGQQTSYQTAQNWTNTGFDIPNYYSGTSSIYWSFARAPGFFDVVVYNGTGSATTKSHNLGVAPELIIVKSTGTSEWYVYAKNVNYSGKTAAQSYLLLNRTDSVYYDDTIWNATAPTSSVFSIGTSTGTNASGQQYVTHMFATLAGVSKVSTYTGTGAAQNIDCGFASGARFVMIKRTDSTGDWYVYDSARGINASGSNDPYLLLNSTAAEVTTTDYLGTYSSGFALTSTAPAAMNANGGTFIFLAIA